MFETISSNNRAMEFIPRSTEPSARLHLLVVDPDLAVRTACAEIALGLGYAAESTGDLAHARIQLRGRPADILLVNLPAGANHGLELISEVKLLYPNTTVIAMTASGGRPSTIPAVCAASRSAAAGSASSAAAAASKAASAQANEAASK